MALRALIVEDVLADAELVIRELARGRELVTEVVATAAQTRAALTGAARAGAGLAGAGLAGEGWAGEGWAGEGWDVVLADWAVPGFGALEALAIVRELGLDVPVIIVSGALGEEAAAAAMRAGVRDFVHKERLFRLVPAVERELRDAATRAAGRRAERELRAAAERYRQLFESSPLPMWVFDTDSLRFLAVNDAAIRRYGYTRDEFLARSLTDVRPIEDHTSLREDIAQRTDSARVWRHLTKHGEELAVEITAHDLEFEGRRARLVLANDVTQRARLEDQLRQSQKMEAIGRLAGGVAHDFNNLLTAIIGSMDLAIASLPEEHEATDELRHARGSAMRATDLTKRLLTFSRQKVSAPLLVDVRDIVRGMQPLLVRTLGEQ
ncbi:MAG TPA: PAS domain S-box protein, partial [Kofleriaceae bacterium]|nr:PAS domain S-box protein [Kofleriaceae bacterium]